MILILFLYAILAATFTIGKMLLAFISPVFLIGLRMTLAGLLLLSFQWIWHGRCRIKQQDFFLFLIVSMVHILIPFVTEFVALQRIAPSCAAFMFNLTPCFTAYFSFLFFGELMTPKKWVGFLISILATVWIILPETEQLACWSLNSSYFLLTISVIFASLGWVLVRLLLQRGYSVLMINGSAMFLGGIQALLLVDFVENPTMLSWGDMKEFLFLFFLLIFLANILFYNAYGALLKRYTATWLSFLGLTTPLFTALYDWYLLGITIHYTFVIATIFMIFGMYIFWQEELRQGYALG